MSFVRATDFSKPVRAFSLVELLVSVMIITVLTALLLPAGRRVLEKSYGMRCTSNLKQIGTAIQMYAADNDNFIVR